MAETTTIGRLTPEDYRDQLLSLLPVGPLWPRDADSALALLMLAFGEEFARLHNRAMDFIEIERDPRLAFETLADWERFAGLPDPCAGAEQTLDGRRRRLVATLTARGGASPQYFIDLAAALGYEIRIIESRPLYAGFHAGDACWNSGSAYHWRVRAPLNTVTYLTAGFGAGEPLSSWGNESLECFIRDRAPDHTFVDFAYVPPFGGPISLPAEAILGGGPITLAPEFTVSPGSLA
jgi:uncharacterized protein YmfQ (DUF2313 family)